MSSQFTTVNLVAAKGAELYAERTVADHENVDGETILLLSEAEAPSSRWPGSLVSGLVDSGLAVIRFDTRDIGRSSWVEEPYGMSDLVADAVAVLDHFDVDAAHVIGRSMGGVVAQHLALDRPDRVTTLSLVSTTPGRREDLGAPEQWLIDLMTERLFEGPPDGDVERMEWIVDQLEWFAGPVFGFDRDEAIRMVAYEVSDFWRGQNMHGSAVVEAADRFEELVSIVAPTIVVHGTADPVYPLLHGQALADQISTAQLLLIEGLGHEFPERFVTQFIELFDHFRRST